jgi:Fe-S-cluster containining protein
MSADPDELERQLERGAVFTHSALTEQVERTNENEALLNGLIDVLVKRGVVSADELTRAIESVRRETAETGRRATLGTALRVDGPVRPPAAVDCAARLPVCRAVCCRLRFALSAEDIEAGALKWDLARPYYNRRGRDGYCHRCDHTTRACGIYEQRPTVCQAYSCADDARIWTDFAAMELNHEWIEANLGGDEPGPVEIFMDAYAP